MLTRLGFLWPPTLAVALSLATLKFGNEAAHRLRQFAIRCRNMFTQGVSQRLDCSVHSFATCPPQLGSKNRLPHRIFLETQALPRESEGGKLGWEASHFVRGTRF
jgi:hypothetical protein